MPDLPPTTEHGSDTQRNHHWWSVQSQVIKDAKEDKERSEQSTSDKAMPVQQHKTKLTTAAVAVDHELSCKPLSWGQRPDPWGCTHTQGHPVPPPVESSGRTQSNYKDTKFRPLRLKLFIVNHLLISFKHLYYKDFFKFASEEYVNSKFYSEQQLLLANT